MPDDEKKQVIGLYEEMSLAMELHDRGWQVYRGYIDHNIDFIATKYFCPVCNKYVELFTRETTRKNKKTNKITEHKTVTNLCDSCEKNEVQVIERYLQVKTSGGKASSKDGIRKYNFHAKLRHNIDIRAFYVWIAVTRDERGNKISHFYIFHHTEISKFDDLSLPSYQETDNQKTTLNIDRQGNVLNRGKKHSYDCFIDFHNNFKKLEPPPEDVF